jgi:outer membrane murein-binding lipoprotein Lpp
LSDLWRDLAAELEKEEAAAESTVEAILAGAADDQKLAEKSSRIASLGAQVATLRKKANLTGTALQTRLEKDIAATEWLALNWLAHRLLVETTKLLETVSPEKRESVTEAASVLAEAGIAYHASVSALGVTAPVSWAWQRPIESVTEKNLAALRSLNDPLYKAPDPQETIASLIAAAKIQQTRWQSLLIAIGLCPGFEMPSYEEPEPEAWTPTKEQAGIVSGPPTPGIVDNPNQPRIHYTWEPADLEKPPWEQSKAG